MATKKREISTIEQLEQSIDRSQTYNPLLAALHENDKKNLFKSNVSSAFIKTGFHLFDYYFGSVINIHDEFGKIIRQEPRIGQAAGSFNLIVGPTGSGKAQPLWTQIPTPNGWTAMGDLKVGDYVFTHNGYPTKVVGVFPQGTKKVYRITFSDDREAYCCGEHLWNIIDKHGRETTKSINEILDELNGVDKKIDGHDWGCIWPEERAYNIPRLKGHVQYTDQPVVIDPYVIGILLSCGRLYAEDLTIEGSMVVADKLASLTKSVMIPLNDTNGLWSFAKHGSKIPTAGFLSQVSELIDKKDYKITIPDQYMYTGYDKRLRLLEGIFSSIGEIVVDGNSGNVSLVLTHPSVAFLSNVQEIIRSLGYNAFLTEFMLCEDMPDEKTIRTLDDGRLSGSLEVDAPIEFMIKLLKSRKDLYSVLVGKRSGWRDDLYITSIEPIGEEECQCIKVESPSELYITDEFIVTHNTTLACQIAGNIIRQYEYANVIHFDCENRFDISRAESITRLPGTFFNADSGERYMIKTGRVGLDVIQEMIVKTSISKLKLKDILTVDTGLSDEFGKPLKILQPTVIIIDSITTVLNETFNPDNQKEATDAEKMRGNTEGARDAKSLKGFFKDVLPLCKEANIIIYGINHINQNMSMNAFIPVAKQQNYLKQDESIPGGRTMLYYPSNIVKLTAKTGDDFTEEGDGFNGHMVMIEPIKCSSNQSGNNSKGISFEMVFSQKYGFDPLRTMIIYGRDRGLIEGNRNRLRFKDDDSYTFSFKNINADKDAHPIWEDINKYIVPTLSEHLAYADISAYEFDDRSMAY